MDAQSPMALILVGQNELWERRNLLVYAAIRQRIDLQCKLHHYDRSDLGQYMERHLAYDGAKRSILSEKAIDEIHRFSGGAPRLVKEPYTHCLIYGAQNRQQIIDGHMVEQVIQGQLS